MKEREGRVKQRGKEKSRMDEGMLDDKGVKGLPVRFRVEVLYKWWDEA